MKYQLQPLKLIFFTLTRAGLVGPIGASAPSPVVEDCKPESGTVRDDGVCVSMELWKLKRFSVTSGSATLECGGSGVHVNKDFTTGRNVKTIKIASLRRKNVE